MSVSILLGDPPPRPPDPIVCTVCGNMFGSIGTVKDPVAASFVVWAECHGKRVSVTLDQKTLCKNEYGPLWVSVFLRPIVDLGMPLDDLERGAGVRETKEYVASLVQQLSERGPLSYPHPLVLPPRFRPWGVV